MGYLESEVYRYFDKHGPLKHLNKQLLDRHYNTTLPGAAVGRARHLGERRRERHPHPTTAARTRLADEEMGSSSWIMLADFDTRLYGKGLAMVNMSAVPDYCIEEGQEGQNYFPKGDECIGATHSNTHPSLVGQGALVLFNRWTYHRTASRGPVPVPAGLERAVHVTRWVHPNARASLTPDAASDKTGGSRAGNRCAALGLGARNYFCRSHPNRREKPAWKAYAFDMLHGSADLRRRASSRCATACPIRSTRRCRRTTTSRSRSRLGHRARLQLLPRREAQELAHVAKHEKVDKSGIVDLARSWRPPASSTRGSPRRASTRACGPERTPPLP